MKIVNRLSVLFLVFASYSTTAEECGGPVVSLGEVMAGFQAGFTAGSHTDVGNPADFFVTLGGETRRGFIFPEYEASSVQCENDYVLIAGFLGAGIETASGIAIRTPKEAKDNVSSGFEGLIPSQRFEIDGVQIEHMNTAVKVGFLPEPDGIRYAVLTSGVILQPFSLLPGIHNASVIYDLDVDKDGIVDYELPFTASFTITAAPEE